MRRSKTQRRYGFTLLETMIVVVIIGILSALAVYGVRKYVFSAKSAEARQMILAIKAAEETYREETYVYMSASADGFGSGNETKLFPQRCLNSAPNQKKFSWEQPPDDDCAAPWRELGVTSTNPVQYGYAVTAVGPGVAMTTAIANFGSFTWSGSVGPGFAVIAKGDLNGDGTFSLFLGSNFTDEIHVENEIE